MNRDTFFDRIRARPFNGSMSKSQVDAVNAILAAWDKCGDGDDAKLAYVLATAKWEPGADMKPRTEGLSYSSAKRLREVWPLRFPDFESAKPYVKNARKLANKVYGGRMGNTDPDDGWTYRGRGLVQITGKNNYKRASAELGLDLVNKPDLALNIDVAAEILVRGMMEGWFTGHELADFMGDGTFDFLNARRVVNGLDRAKEIAAIATAFHTAVCAAGGSPKPEPAPPPPPPPDIPKLPEKPPVAKPERDDGAVRAIVLGIVALVVAGFVIAILLN